ncbi:MAG: shikimate kinase [Pseudomonadota bacterium]
MNKTGKNIVLTGFMGVGKDTVGKVAAQTLGFKFISTDEILLQQERKPLFEIINNVGEDEFHKMEENVLTTLLNDKKGRMVISTGGEIVARPECLPIIKKLGLVVYLYTSPKEIFDRMIKTPYKRPRFKELKGEELEKEVNALMKIREKLYQSIKDIEINTQGRSPLETAEEIIDAWTSMK